MCLSGRDVESGEAMEYEDKGIWEVSVLAPKKKKEKEKKNCEILVSYW